MIEVSKHIYIEMAHRLPNYDGACRNLHGHSWRLEATVRRIDGLYGLNNNKGESTEGMTMDFAELKKILQLVHDRFDHSTTLSYDDPLLTNVTCPEGIDSVIGKLNSFMFPPTSEKLAEYWASMIRARLPKGIQLVRVKVNETCTSEATYTIER